MSISQPSAQPLRSDKAVDPPTDPPYLARPRIEVPVMLSRRLLSTTLAMSSRKAANASQIPLQAKKQVEQTKHEAGPSNGQRRTPLTVDSLRSVPLLRCSGPKAALLPPF